MTEDKIKRLIVAMTVGAVLLIVILASIMIYQIVAINVEKDRKAQIEAKISEYDRLIEEGEESLIIRSNPKWIEYQARKLGYIHEGDKSLGN